MCGGGVEGGVAGLFGVPGVLGVLGVLGVRVGDDGLACGDGVGAVGGGGVVEQAGAGDGLCGESRHSS